MRHILAALFPSWAFFIEPGPSIRLEYFAGGNWHRAIEPIARHWSRLLFNPEAGYLHAANNAVDRLLSAAAEMPDELPDSRAGVSERGLIEGLPEYIIVKNLARLAAESANTVCLRFRILAGDEVVFLSPEFE